MIPRIRAAILAVALAGAATPTLGLRPAHAQEKDDDARARAQRSFAEGERLYAEGSYDAALAAYRDAFAAVPLPELVFNIGQCQRNLEQYDEAIASFKRYLRLKPDAANRPAVEKLIAELESRYDARPRTTPKPKPVPLVPSPSDREAERPTPRGPIYTRWWFIGGTVLVTAGAVTAGILLWPDGSTYGQIKVNRP